jgi:lipopolysaccharide export system protein LptA
MKKKIQIVLLVILFVLIFLFYKIFFLTEKKVVIQQIDEVITQEEKLNEIEKLRYFSEDITGNKYTIEANSASAMLVDSNLVELSGVLANIVLKSKGTIYITSDSAKYNQITNNTNFFDNVKVIYEDNEIYSNNIDLNFEKNLIEVYGNVFYKNPGNKLYADKILLNLLTKNLKIIMKKKEDNILIISNYSK